MNRIPACKTWLPCLLILVATQVVAQNPGPGNPAVDQLYQKSRPFWSSNRDSANYYLNKAYQLSVDDSYLSGQAYALYGLGINESILYRQFQFFTQSLELSEKLKDEFVQGVNLVRIGFIYERIGEPETALDYYQRALVVKKRIKDDGGVALSLINIGLYYKHKGELDTALKYFNESLIYRKKAGTKQGIAYAQLNIAETLFDYGKIENARISADSSISNFATTSDIQGQLRALMLAARILKSNNKNDEAFAVYQLIIERGKDLPLDYNVLQTRKELVKYFSDKGDIAKVFKFQSEYLVSRDSMEANDYRTETLRQASEFEFKLAQRQEQQKKELADRKVARRNTLEYLGVAIAIFVAFTLVFAARKRITNSNVVLLLSLLLLFEFLLVLTDPAVDNITSGDPILKLLANIVLALVILPIHRFLENFIQKRIFSTSTPATQ